MLDFGVHGHIIGVQCIEWDTKVYIFNYNSKEVAASQLKFCVHKNLFSEIRYRYSNSFTISAFFIIAQRD